MNIETLLNNIETTLWLYILISLFILIMWLYALYSTIKIKDMMKEVCKLLEMQTLLTNKLDDKLKDIDEKIKADKNNE